MRCKCCNRPFTPTRTININGLVEFEKYCQECLDFNDSDFNYSDEHMYQHTSSEEVVSQCVKGNTLQSVFI